MFEIRLSIYSSFKNQLSFWKADLEAKVYIEIKGEQIRKLMQENSDLKEVLTFKTPSTGSL